MDTIQAIQKRQGVLAYRPDPVPRELVEIVLRAACAAPSPANTQPWEWIAVHDPELVSMLVSHLIKTQEKGVFRTMLDTPPEFTGDLMKLYRDLEKAPWWIVLCRHRRAQLGPPELNSLIRDWELCSLGAAMGILMTAAVSLGLGSRWFGNPMLDPEPIKELLKIPEELEIIAASPLGYHDQPQKKRPKQDPDVHHKFSRGDKYALASLLQGRLPWEEVTHFNYYGQS